MKKVNELILYEQIFSTSHRQISNFHALSPPARPMILTGFFPRSEVCTGKVRGWEKSVTPSLERYRSHQWSQKINIPKELVK